MGCHQCSLCHPLPPRQRIPLAGRHGLPFSKSTRLFLQQRRHSRLPSLILLWVWLGRDVVPGVPPRVRPNPPKSFLRPTCSHLAAALIVRPTRIGTVTLTAAGSNRLSW